jgi:2-dehydro-3-deoxy-D-gluconate 5-dehydrogenase
VDGTSPQVPPLSRLIDLDEKTALVTGAAQGFGFACARRLAEAGAAVVLADWKAGRVQAAAARLEEAGARAKAVHGDVGDERDVERLIGTAVEAFGGLEILVNNAGVFSNYLLASLEAEEFRHLLRVNVEGVYLCTRAAVAQMRRQGRGGSIVNVTSIDAVHPTSLGMAHYTTTKHAIWGFTKAMALELGPEGIRINAVAPGPSLTEGTVEYIEAGAPEGIDIEAQWARAAERVPMRRWADPDEIGRVALFLASDLASYVHGAQIVVDGGYLVA